MTSRALFAALCVVAGGLLSPAVYAQTTLTLDGLSAKTATVGSSVRFAISGTPGRPVALFVDVDPGPTPIGGQSVALAFTPSAVGEVFVMPAGGSLSLDKLIPLNERLHGTRAYFVAVVDEDGTLPGLAWSNGADLLVVDRDVELAGHSLAQFPYFERVLAVNRGSAVDAAVDVGCYPALQGGTADLYVVAAKTATQWDADPTLVDVRGAPQSVALSGTTLQENTFALDAGTLPGPDETPGAGDTRIGVPYDVVVDVDRDGRFGGADLIDGYDDREAGFYVVRDTALGGIKPDGVGGPYVAREILYNRGTFLAQNTYYPRDLAMMGKLPLVVVSHGNGHDYRWYDHIGYHLASYGYIVMSHQNNTGPGSHTAALTTLQNTDEIIGFQSVIRMGVLDGHIDSNNITWIGHSRGGDGVARAYDMLYRGTYTPQNFSIDDIKLVSSIAPVDFGGTTGNPASDPHDVPAYHLWVAQADADVNGCPGSGDQVKWYLLHERATGARQSISIHGVGHGDYHDGPTGSVASGPCLVGRPNTHTIMRGYLLPLVEHYIRGDVPSRDFLWRQYEGFHAVSSAAGVCANVNLNLQDSPDSGKLVIDDFETNPDPATASSGAAVVVQVDNYLEGALADNNADFTWTSSDSFNGFIQDSTSPAFTTGSSGAVFDYQADASISYALPDALEDFRPFEFLSFRCAQGTRHPSTLAELADLTFTVELEDAAGVRSAIRIDAYGGGGVEEPYRRNTGPMCGTGRGWNSEFETIRLRVEDFRNNCGLSLRCVEKLTFYFGPSWGSSQGRLALDEIELTTQ
ncbi:MAG: hypothetical protein AAF628_14170 [Planctomycetota bacterium]